MRKNGKKALSLFLVLVLVLGMVPGAAWAATSGTCGNNLTWSKANSVLTIRGSGAMYDYGAQSSNSDAPWYSRTDFTTLEMEYGATSIGRNAFAWCMALRELNIPSSVTSIGDYAFRYCHGLQKITIPDSVRTIGSDAFYRCDGLKNVRLSKSLSYISADTFGHCGNLTRVYIPVSVSGIGEGAFSACSSLTDVYYYGTMSQWNYINIGSNNDSLLHATIHYSYSPQHMVEFNANGGYVGTTSKIVTDDDAYGTLPIPTCTGYSFAGWFTAANGGTRITSDTIVNLTADQTLYAHWTPASYTITFNANGGTLGPTSKNVTNGETYGSLPTPARSGYRFDGWYTASSGGTRVTSDTTVSLTANQTLYAHWTYAPSSYTVMFNANGGTVSPTSKNVTNGETYGSLPTPARSGYRFDGWYTASSGGSLVTSSTTVTQNQDHTLYAHWTSTVDPYNLGDETYSFRNYGDSDSAGGHCFGMSITSAGYHNGLLDIGTIGGNANTPLYSFSATQTVKRPICHYQGMQGSYAARATVAGGSFYLSSRYDMASDWQEVVDYVSDHSYDDSGLLQIGFRKNSQGGHAINFLRYENVNGQDRIYAYDNNFPTQETYFYRDSSGSVRQAPVQTFSGSIDCIALRDCRRYFSSVGDFDATHVLYMAEDSASVEGEYTMSYMETGSSDTEYVMYEIPENVDEVTIIPKTDNATFIYMDEEYKFGEITDDTRGVLKLAAEDTVDSDASFQVYEDPAPSTHFTDVPAASWYHDAVYWAVDQQITAGTSATTFTPDRTCTETEILTFLWRAAGQPASTAQLPFTPKAAWAADALRWAYEKGMIGASFNENAPCTRASAVKFIWQASGSHSTAVANSFTDVPAGAHYAQAVAWAVSKGITAGTSATTFSPNKTCSRAEIVTFLYRDRTDKT